MAEEIKNQDTAFVDNPDNYGGKTRAVPVPKREIGIDFSNQFLDDVIAAGEKNSIDISKIDSFSRISQNRNTMYQMLDTMSEDSIIASALQTYAEDSTESNDSGKIVWCESDDPDIAKYITFLLDTFNVDKHIYGWAYALCKYGDIYLRLFRKSECDDGLFSNYAEHEKLNEQLELLQLNKEKELLKEDVNIKVFSKADRYSHYIEMVPNPAEMFELTKFGKTYAYIRADVGYNLNKNTDNLVYNTYKYAFKKKNVDVYDATEFVHAMLEDNQTRTPEEISIFNEENDEHKLSYTVKRGQSLLFSSFKIWREMMLLENAMLLNRLTKSSLVRIVQVEVGDMPKEQVAPHIQGVKQLMEQKSAIDTGNSLNEYTNPGPMENDIYVPTRNGQGTISLQQVGGDANVTGLEDVDYFSNKLFGSLRIPKQYLGNTDDATGFNGGSSLALISSRYGKEIKKIKNTLIQALTDVVNLYLIDKGLVNYINKFQIRMVQPATQEERDRTENISNKTRVAADLMQLIEGLPTQSAKLKILKNLMSSLVDDPEIIDVIKEEIKVSEEQEENGETPENEGGDNEFMPSSGGSLGGSSDLGDLGDLGIGEEPTEEGEAGSESEPSETSEPEETIGKLPNPSDLGVDFTDNSNPAFEG